MRPRAVVAALLLLAATAAPAWGATRRYAVVVAHTRSLTEGVAPLEFADDDGARYHEFFSVIADEVLLYTVLDADSQRLYPDAAAVARSPSRELVLKGLADTFNAAQEAVDRGDDVVFYFVLIGHGEVGAGGEGYVSLLDAPFTRTDLFREVLAKSPATTNHVVVDACNSYFLVHARGSDADDGAPADEEAVRAFVAEEDLSRYPNTGVLLSTSSARESHEWAAYGAGVFSHQLRSALAGAADVNGDGRIEYSEIRAFVDAANLRIDDAKARLEIFARPPEIDASRPVVDLPASRFRHWLHVPKGAALQFYLEDARGVRYLDANLNGDRAAVLALVPSAHYFVRSSDGAKEQRLSLATDGRITLERKRMRRAALAARGATSESFRTGLFAVPYGASFYEGYVAHSGDRPVREGTAWLPPAQVVDAAFVDAELDRLNAGARDDARLGKRLRAATPALLEALDRRRFAKAAELLGAIEHGD